MTIGLFVLFVVASLVAVFAVSRRTATPTEFYVAGRTVGAPHNGLALCGAFLMWTSFLALTGEIALKGYDGFLFAVGFAVSWLVMLLLVAEPIRNTGKFTLGDVLSVRMSARPARTAAAVVTLIVFFFYITVQMVGAGSLVSALLEVSDPGAQALMIVAVGLLTIVYVVVGGMRGTTWVQSIKAGLLLLAVAVMAVLVLAAYRANPSAMLGDAVAKAGPKGEAWLNPGLKFGDGLHKIEFVSQLFTVVVGHAALPYLFMRFNTVRTGRDARRSVSWATWLIGPYYLLTIVIGFGAAAILGPQIIGTDPSRRNVVALLLADELGGPTLLAFVGAVVLLTILAVTAGLTISAAASFTHDIYANVIKRGKVEPAREVAVAKWAVVVIGLLAIVSGIVFMRQNIAFMLSLDVTLVASSVLPTLLYSWFWRRFNTSGVLWSMYGGLITTVVLVIFSPAVSGGPLAMIPGADFAWFPWKYVGIVSIPLAFLYGYLGTILSKEHDDAAFAVMEVRALTGAGAALPTDEEEERPAPASADRELTERARR